MTARVGRDGAGTSGIPEAGSLLGANIELRRDGHEYRCPVRPRAGCG